MQKDEWTRIQMWHAKLGGWFFERKEPKCQPANFSLPRKCHLLHFQFKACHFFFCAFNSKPVNFLWLILMHGALSRRTRVLPGMRTRGVGANKVPLLWNTTLRSFFLPGSFKSHPHHNHRQCPLLQRALTKLLPKQMMTLNDATARDYYPNPIFSCVGTHR